MGTNKVKKKEKMQKVLVIYTGGTIGMMMDPEDKALKPFEFKNIRQQLPMLDLLECDITFKSLLPLIDFGHQPAVLAPVGRYDRDRISEL